MGKKAAEHGVTAWLHVTNLSRGVNVYYVCFTEYVFQDILTCRISQFAKFSSANVFMQRIRQIFPLPKFPSIRYKHVANDHDNVGLIRIPEYRTELT